VHLRRGCTSQCGSTATTTTNGGSATGPTHAFLRSSAATRCRLMFSSVSAWAIPFRRHDDILPGGRSHLRSGVRARGQAQDSPAPSHSWRPATWSSRQDRPLRYHARGSAQPSPSFLARRRRRHTAIKPRSTPRHGAGRTGLWPVSNALLSQAFSEFRAPRGEVGVCENGGAGGARQARVGEQSTWSNPVSSHE
jgi:hypothetical protein